MKNKYVILDKYYLIWGFGKNDDNEKKTWYILIL